MPTPSHPSAPTFTLGGQALNPFMLWLEREDSFGVAQVVRHTLGGNLVVFTQTLLAGEPVTLEAEQDRGWLDRAQVQALRAMADQAGATFLLVVGSESYSVMFRNHEPPAVEMRPLLPRLDPSGGDFYIGRVKLMKV